MQSYKVVLLSYNHPEITEKSMESILTHIEPEQVGLIHNGSESRWIERLQKKFPQIHHLLIANNKGFTGGVNAGLKNYFQTASWVLLVTNDCLLTEFNGPPRQSGFYAPLIYRRKQDVVDSVGGFFNPHRGAIWHCRSESEFVNSKLRKYIPGTAFWIHREVFESVGELDESLHTYWEDVDYSQKVSVKGFPLASCTNTKFIHRVGKTCHKDPFYTKFLFQRNRRIISYKYCPWYATPFLFLNFKLERLKSLLRRSKTIFN